MPPSLISETATKNGLPRGAYAYAPSENPDSWTLPYLTPDGAPDPAALPIAIQSLVEGTVPLEALPSVKAKLRQALRRSGADETSLPAVVRESDLDIALMEHGDPDRPDYWKYHPNSEAGRASYATAHGMERRNGQNFDTPETTARILADNEQRRANDPQRQPGYWDAQRADPNSPFGASGPLRDESRMPGMSDHDAQLHQDLIWREKQWDLQQLGGPGHGSLVYPEVQDRYASLGTDLINGYNGGNRSIQSLSPDEVKAMIFAYEKRGDAPAIHFWNDALAMKMGQTPSRTIGALDLGSTPPTRQPAPGMSPYQAADDARRRASQSQHGESEPGYLAEMREHGDPSDPNYEALYHPGTAWKDGTAGRYGSDAYDAAFSKYVQQGTSTMNLDELDAALQRAHRMGKPVAVNILQGAIHDRAQQTMSMAGPSPQVPDHLTDKAQLALLNEIKPTSNGKGMPSYRVSGDGRNVDAESGWTGLSYTRGANGKWWLTGTLSAGHSHGLQTDTVVAMGGQPHNPFAPVSDAVSKRLNDIVASKINESAQPHYLIDLVASEMMQPAYVIEALADAEFAEKHGHGGGDSGHHFYGAWFGGSKGQGGHPEDGPRSGGTPSGHTSMWDQHPLGLWGHPATDEQLRDPVALIRGYKSLKNASEPDLEKAAGILGQSKSGDDHALLADIQKELSRRKVAGDAHLGMMDAWAAASYASGKMAAYGEAGDPSHHFYGAWYGGAASAGGHARTTGLYGDAATTASAPFAGQPANLPQGWFVAPEGDMRSPNYELVWTPPANGRSNSVGAVYPIPGQPGRYGVHLNPTGQQRSQDVVGEGAMYESRQKAIDAVVHHGMSIAEAGDSGRHFYGAWYGGKGGHPGVNNAPASDLKKIAGDATHPLSGAAQDELTSREPGLAFPGMDFSKGPAKNTKMAKAKFSAAAAATPDAILHIHAGNEETYSSALSALRGRSYVTPDQRRRIAAAVEREFGVMHGGL